MGRDGEAAFAGYLYEIRQNGLKVAEFRHSHRNNEYEIRRASLGQWEEFDDILEGGGPEPLRVSPSGAEALGQCLRGGSPMTEKQLDDLWAFIHIAFRVLVFSMFAFIIGGVGLVWFAMKNGAH